MDDERAHTTPGVTAPEPTAEPPAWVASMVRRGIWWAISAILITLAALWFLGVERSLVRYLVTAALFALALDPAVTWLNQNRGWRRGSATGVLLAGLFVVLVVFAVSLAAVVAREANQVVDQLPAYIDKLNAFTRDQFQTTFISASQRADAVDATNHVADYLREHTDDVIGGVTSALSGIFSLFTIGLFTFYLAADGPKVRRALLARLPPERQARVLFAGETAIQKVGAYLYSRLTLAAINAAVMFITLKIVGAPFALPLSLFVGIVAEFIPIVGTYLAGVVPILVVLAENGPAGAVVVLIEIIVYQQLENYVLSPRISAKTIELNAGVAFGAAMAGGAVGGFLGAFFALPIAATIQEFIKAYGTTYAVIDSSLTRVEEPAAPKPRKKRRLRSRLRSRSSEDDEGADTGTLA
jgi:predicted PurR-regulated permease PerM